MNQLRASKAWLDLWGGVAITLLILAFCVPFRWWAVALAVSFVPMELTGLFWNDNDRRPPLTEVVRVYVPMQLCLPIIWGLWAGAGWAWGAWHHGPFWFSVWMAVLGFFTGHFAWAYLGPKSD